MSKKPYILNLSGPPNEDWIKDPESRREELEIHARLGIGYRVQDALAAQRRANAAAADQPPAAPEEGQP